METTRVGRVIGTGLLAGLAGTALMTVAQRIQMRLAQRPPSMAPAKAIEKLLQIEPKNERAEQRLATATHWSYGSTWGLARALARELGLEPLPATLAQLALIWGTELTVLPRMRVLPPLGMWNKREIAQDLVFHGVYATTTGLAYDALRSRPGFRIARRRPRTIVRSLRRKLAI